MPPARFQAVLLIAFGGPTRREEIRPFLDNVTRGRPIPSERLEEVVHHYERIGGRSPFNELTFRQAKALADVLRSNGLALRVFVGMRNWHPYLDEILEAMSHEGITRALGVILSAQESEAGWRRYIADVARARTEIAARGGATPEIEFAPGWHDAPLFIEAVASRVEQALAELPAERRGDAPVVFTAHSIPLQMADGSPYVAQLRRSCELVARRLGRERWELAYQSRSGRPQDPWLEPDINRVVERLGRDGVRDVVVVPIGFVCDHVEVLYDLDVEARETAARSGVRLTRAMAVNDHPVFIAMLATLVQRGCEAAG